MQREVELGEMGRLSLLDVTSNGPIEFHIPGNSEDSIDWDDVKLYLKTTRCFENQLSVRFCCA